MIKVLSTLIALALTITCMGGARTVDIKGEGKYYNSVWKNWSKEPIWVYVDHKGNFYIAGGNSIIKARGYLEADQLDPVVEALKKSQEWAKKAKENQMEVAKEIADFMTPARHDKTGVKLTFFASNKGQQTDVVILIKDFENMFEKIELYLDPEQVAKLIEILSKVPATYKELMEQEKKAAELN